MSKQAAAAAVEEAVVAPPKRRSLSRGELVEWGRELQFVEISELGPGAGVHYERLSAGQVIAYATSQNDPAAQQKAMITLVGEAVCDEEGKALFDLNNPDDYIAVREIKSAIFNKISSALLGNTKTAEAAAKNGSGEAAATQSASPTS